MGKAKGTNKADKITVNASEVIVVTGKNGKPKSYVITKSGKNTINAAAGKDTITISGGKSNYIYGGKGSDTFVISKKSTSTAIVKDFSNKEIVQIAGGAVKNIKGSGKDIIIYGGKKGKAYLTLKNAKGKTFTVKDSSNIYTVTKGVVGVTLKKNFTGTFKAPSFVTTINASKVERNKIVVRGNDKGNTIKLKNGSLHEIYGGAGKDTITVIGGTNHEIQAGAGKDIITVTGGNFVDVYGDNSSYTTKGDNDTITVNGGKNIYVHGYGGNDVITVIDGTDLCIWGGDGKDTITVYGGSGHKIYGGQEKDNIYIYGGTFKEIDCSDDGGGGDKIIVSEKAQGGAKDNAVIRGGAGGDMITVSAGTNYSIYGRVGDDKITLENSKTYAWVDGDYGNDTITVNNSNNTLINGGGDDDTITVTGGTDNRIIDKEGNNYINAESLKSSGGGSAKIECSPGNDTITLTNCSGYNVNPGAGANKITINGGQKNIIFYDNYDDKGDDIIDIKGGTEHKVTSRGGKVTVSGSGTTCDINIEQGNGSATLLAGKTTLNFCSYNSGNFTINAAKGTLTGDLITFKSNSSDQFTFDFNGSTLTLTGKNGAGSLTIYNFTNGAFAGGIKFSNKNMSYDTIVMAQ